MGTPSQNMEKSEKKNWEGLRQKSEGLFLNWGNDWLQSKKK